MFECGFELFVADITNEDMEITERWLVKVSVIEESSDEDEDEDGEEYINKKLVLELINRFATGETLVLGFEVAKLPILYLGTKERMFLEEGKKAIVNIRRKEKE